MKCNDWREMSLRHQFKTHISGDHVMLIWVHHKNTMCIFKCSHARWWCRQLQSLQPSRYINHLSDCVSDRSSLTAFGTEVEKKVELKWTNQYGWLYKVIFYEIFGFCESSPFHCNAIIFTQNILFKLQLSLKLIQRNAICWRSSIRNEIEMETQVNEHR